MKLGGLDISTVKLGASQVQAIYQGPNLVWQNAPVATAATGIGQTSFTANWNAYSGATYYLLDVSESSDFSTFVYENQFVEAPNTSYVVIGLNSNTTYYYRVRASNDDVDAALFSQRVIAAGGTLSTTEQDAVNTLVVQMKADGIWSKMKAIYPMVGASAAACAQNLKSSSFTGTFTSGWTFASSGATPNGTSAFMDSGLNMSTNLNQNNTHVMVYSRTNTTAGTVMIGGSDSSLNGGCYIFPRFSPTIAYFSIFDGINGNSKATIASSLGFLLASRLISTQEIYYQDSSKITTNSYNSVTPASINIYIGANNRNGNAVNFSNRETAFASIGDGLTDTEASDFYTSVQAFQTTLNRAII